MATRVAAALLLLLTLFPVANLLPGGESDPGYWSRLADWGWGFALCLAIGVLVWFLSRTRPAPRPAAPAREAGAAANGAGDWTFAVSVSTLALLLYVSVALFVFDGRPLLIDEIVQVLQARDYAAGVLSQAVNLPREFFSMMHLVDIGDRVYGQYPPGGPAMLVPGVWLGAEWLVGPLSGAVSVLLFHALLPVLEPQASVRFRRATVLLFATAPFGAFMFGSHMNHATTLAWLLLAAWALSRAVREGAVSWWGLLVGLALGVAATIRPLDAAAFAVPAAVWLALRARHGRRPLHGWLLSGVGVALPMSLMFWVNLQTTGHPLQFGYDLLWGAGHSLGFHESAWGVVHTPARGVELLSLYFTRLGTYLFEAPFPSTLLAAAGLWAARDVSHLDRYWLWSGLLLGVGYWAYWHDGFYLGPRFLFAALPLLVLWSARGVRAVWAVASDRPAVRRGVVGALTASAAYALITVAIVRVPTYRNGLVSLRVDAEREAAAAAVSNAIVLVQESWGAQVMARLWAAEVSRSDAERLYRGVDTCRLDLALASATSAGVRGPALSARLLPLLADSAVVVPSDRSPDFTERVDPRMAYPPSCVARIEEDRAGYLLYSPWRLAQDSNLYLRWLPGREAEAADAYPGRAVYRVRRSGPTVGASLVWEQLVAAGVDETGTAGERAR